MLTNTRTPIFKSGSRDDPIYFRPISVVSVFSRILQRIVHNQIYEHLKATKALTMNQSAFQNCRSTITSLIDSTHKWYDNINDKQLNLKILLHLKRAFDTVSHATLIRKLRKYGIERAGLNHILKIGNSIVLQMASIRGLKF